jgi:anti-anti-sigma factor
MPHHYGLEISSAGIGEVLLRATGEIDLEVAPQLLDSILCAALPHDRGRVVLDLGGVSFMDSSGLATLIEARRRVREQALELVIVNVTAPVLRMFELTGVAGHLGVGVHADDGSALAD